MKYFSTKRHKTRIEIVESEIIPESFNNISIGYFSDVLSDFENLDKSIESIKKQNVDIILFGGNLLDQNIDGKQQKELITKLKSLDAPLGKYSVLGSEDLNNSSFEILEQSDFRQLTLSGSKIYNFQDDFINLIVLDQEKDIYEGSQENFEILLVNDAKALDQIKDKNVDLILAGKYLGGQYKLPFLEPFGDHAEHYKKRYDENNETMILSQGLGNYGKKMRLNTNAETIIIILRNTNSES